MIFFFHFQALLAAPEPDDPQDAVVARQYVESPSMFKKTAQHWASVFAGASYKHPEFETMLKKLKEMGVEESAARVALSASSWDINKASEKIFN